MESGRLARLPRSGPSFFNFPMSHCCQPSSALDGNLSRATSTSLPGLMTTRTSSEQCISSRIERTRLCLEAEAELDLARPYALDLLRPIAATSLAGLYRVTLPSKTPLRGHAGLQPRTTYIRGIVRFQSSVLSVSRLISREEISAQAIAP